ncbi:MAG: hypothetical protein HWE27_19170 [Gammaproteobacteria bacterium]|nr:hypothetical protein [Gammaproteobacteria bacterium]
MALVLIRKFTHLKSRSLACFLAVFLIGGCSNSDQTNNSSDVNLTTSNEATKPDENAPEHIKKLWWANYANAKVDLKNALEKNDYAFWVLATRQPLAPGLDPKKHSSLISKCGQKYLPGMGDVLFDDAHEKLYTKATQYAVSYNQMLIEHCKNK